MTVKIGVIGCGAIGLEHIKRITNTLSGGKIVAVNDINENNAKKIIADLHLDAKFYADGHELIRSADVDAVLVTCWGPAHKEFVLEAVKQKKYVFCEKPLATTADDCLEIVEEEMKQKKHLVQVGFMRRFDEGYVALKKTIDEGQIGAPLILHAAHRNPAVDEKYTTDMAINDTMIHEIDVLHWLLDDEYISAQVIYPRKTGNASSHLADPQIVLVETKKGIRIDVEIFVNCKYGYDIKCEVVGEDGIAYLPEPATVQTRQKAALNRPILMDWKQRFIKAYDYEIQAFINNINKGQKLNGPTSWDGYAAALTADVCVQAQQNPGKILPIKMKDRPDFYK
ncbi:Gfo/Idh/MocA family protein [Pectinatus haikarae]|uniref:Inositol 2-dehydrogenase/D-chiro-inositol 3-dehydrogenase n=1 Tax=Pectinatus haikarae TaxID=349096 RepID=A0ABT9Y8J5_9FIRM|nr:Gfo/Idh/MocA family oxidoreductase [Pectinatus haikarae]MDQ0204169.1 myo-inositol 2-dehydrogenase/D-chiro-inositol 1-dehydrogenase [Pectinatus haikarae]